MTGVTGFEVAPAGAVAEATTTPKASGLAGQHLESTSLPDAALDVGIKQTGPKEFSAGTTKMIVPEDLSDAARFSPETDEIVIDEDTLDKLENMEQLQYDLDHLISDHNIQPDLSSMNGLTDDINGDLERFMNIMRSKMLNMDGTWDGQTGTWTQETTASGETVTTFTTDDGEMTYYEYRPGDSDSSESNSEDSGVGFWSRVKAFFKGKDDESSDDDDEKDPDDCFPKPWWDEYSFNCPHDFMETSQLLLNPIDMQNYATVWTNRNDGQFLQAVDMVHTRAMWQQY